MTLPSLQASLFASQKFTASNRLVFVEIPELSPLALRQMAHIRGLEELKKLEPGTTVTKKSIKEAREAILSAIDYDDFKERIKSFEDFMKWIKNSAYAEYRKENPDEQIKMLSFAIEKFGSTETINAYDLEYLLRCPRALRIADNLKIKLIEMTKINNFEEFEMLLCIMSRNIFPDALRKKYPEFEKKSKQEYDERNKPKSHYLSSMSSTRPD